MLQAALSDAVFLRGRKLTKEGQRDCDRIAQQILFPQLFEKPEEKEEEE